MSVMNALFVSWHLSQVHQHFSLKLRACSTQEGPELVPDPAGSGTVSRGTERELVTMRARAQTDTDKKHRHDSGK